ncbi:MAG: ribose 5-phosphate isomerase A [Aeropyrum sp.]|nr:ribose 5-phosphate isomerase A [Aeropyrum sp.]MCE4616415.1 ribose 5-phosphate isomerase A [Aeropyrum sp.]
MPCDSKVEAARGAMELLRRLGVSGVAGLGSGSTLLEFLRLFSGELRELFDLVVPSSIETGLEAASLGLVVGDPRVYRGVDVYIDGADEVQPKTGNMVKGGGGALLGEKMLCRSSKLNIFIVGEEKLVDSLGSRTPIPLEVEPGYLAMALESLEALGLNPRVRTSGGKRGPVVSDWGGVIVDLHVGPLEDPGRLESLLRSAPGVRESGLFLGLADYVVVGLRSCGHLVLGPYRREARD